MSKHCSVVCDTAEGLRECELELPEEATVAEVLAAARQRLAELLIDWEGAAVGIHGQLCPRDHVPADADRVEIYRALPADPRAARRARVARDAAGLRKARDT